MIFSVPGQRAEPSLLEFPFRGGRICLDFVATLGSRRRLRIERLRSTTDLQRWFSQAGFGPGPWPCTRGELQEATALREAIYEAATGDPGSAVVARAATTINSCAAKSPLIPQLAKDGSASFVAPGDPIAGAFSTIARDAIELLSSPLRSRLRECEGGDCSLLFLDVSRPGNRRWCSMEVCGNRDKANSLRAKRLALRGVS